MADFLDGLDRSGHLHGASLTNPKGSSLGAGVHDNRFNEVGPEEIRISLHMSIPLDTVYLKLPPKALSKAKKMWDKEATAEK